MPSEVVVHSTAKRFFQVIGIALAMAAALVGLKKVSERDDPAEQSSDTPVVEVVEARPAVEETNAIIGRASVIDADTIEIRGTRIRLEGIDAPESRQRCGGEGRPWACGQQASLALSDWISDRPVICHPQGSDRYQRILARCFVANDDMQGWLVSNGWAMAYRAYSEDYVAAEEHAEATKVGIWRDEFTPPWEWRRSRN